MDMTDYQGILMAQGWTVTWVDSSNSTVATQNETFKFTSNMTIERWNGTTLIGNWATSCVIQDGKLAGFTVSDNREFRIQLDSPTVLNCYFVSTSTIPWWRRWLNGAGLSALLGALIGAAAGAAGSRPVAGALTGLAAALTGSVVTAARINPGPAEVTTGPAVTFIAEDGSSGRKTETGPYALKAVGS